VPFRSEKQRRFMYAKHPDIARRWQAEYGSTPRPKKGGTVKQMDPRMEALAGLQAAHAKKATKKKKAAKKRFPPGKMPPPKFGKGKGAPPQMAAPSGRPY
jgi:hypothetical protein